MIKPIIDLSARTLEYDTGKQAILEKYGKPSKNVTQVFAKRIAHVIKLAGVERTVVYYDNQQLKVDITEQSDAEKYYPDPVFQFDEASDYTGKYTKLTNKVMRVLYNWFNDRVYYQGNISLDNYYDTEFSWKAGFISSVEEKKIKRTILAFLIDNDIKRNNLDDIVFDKPAYGLLYDPENQEFYWTKQRNAKQLLKQKPFLYYLDVRKLPFKEDPTYVNYLDAYVINHRKLDWQNFNLNLDMIPRYYQPQGIPFDTLNWACDHESIDLYAKPETGASLRLIHYIDANVVDKAVEIDFDEEPKADRHFKINKENLDGFYELQSFSDSIVDIVTKANKQIIL